ncbi:MAG: diadenylate cyclase, partial [Dehalococcoidia bacterium]
EQMPLTSELLERYMKVDGAVLIDPTGVCHAFGVILDGATDRGGDPARGSRYNSAVRYQATAGRAPTVVFVTSEDGDVSTVPSPRPRIRRQVVLDAITRLEEAFASPEEPARFADAFKHVRRLQFYLSEDQCNLVNDLANAEEKRRMEASDMAVVWPELTPHPDLDESFFLD